VLALENEGKSADEPNWMMRSSPGVAAMQATDYVKDKNEIELDRELADKQRELQFSFNERLADAARLKQLGNEQLRQHREYEALHSYIEGANSLELMTGNAAPLLSGRLSATATELRRDLLNNAAQAALKAHEWDAAIDSATAALELISKDDSSSSNNSRAKALFRRASAYISQGSGVEMARADLCQLLELQPQNKAAKALLDTTSSNAPAQTIA